MWILNDKFKFTAATIREVYLNVMAEIKGIRMCHQTSYLHVPCKMNIDKTILSPLII